MNKAISVKQLQYTASAFIIASSLLTSNLYHFARNDSWFSVLLGFIASFVMIGIYTALSGRYPGMCLMEINDAVFGKIIGKPVSILYIFYFFELAFFNTRDLGDFVQGQVLQATPLPVIFVVFILTCAWAVRKGPIAMTRYGFFLTFVAIAAILINTALLVNRIDLRNLLPVFTLPPKNYLIGAHIVTMLPFGEIMVFMMFVPHMEKPEKIGRALCGGLVIGGLTLLVVVLRDIVVLGRFTFLFQLPTFSTIRMTDIGDILTRLEIIYAVILTIMLFVKVSVVYYATVSGLGQLFGFRSSKPLILVIGVLTVVYAYACFPEMIEHIQWNLTAAATNSTFFLLVLPLLTLTVSLIRGGGKKTLMKAGES